MAKLILMVPAILVCLVSVALRQRFTKPAWFDNNAAIPSATETMKAVAYEQHGDPSVLRLYERHPRPEPHPRQVLVKIIASAVNPCDFKIRRNVAPNFIIPKPKIPGVDIAGVVVETGSQVSDAFQEGDRVAALLPIMGNRWGSAAEYAAVDESLLAKLASNVDFESAASLPLVALTTIQAFQRLETDITQSKKVLIHAGAGGVGTFAIQYAKHVLGMYVATTASPAKAEFLKELGADLVIDYKSEKFEEVVRGYDVVFDTMSWDYEARTLGRTAHVLKRDGQYINIVSSDWKLSRNERTIGLLSLWNFAFYKLWHKLKKGVVPNYDMLLVSPNGAQLQIALDLVQNATIRPVIDQRFHFTNVAQAHAYLEQGHATGKVVLQHEDEIVQQKIA